MASRSKARKYNKYRVTALSRKPTTSRNFWETSCPVAVSVLTQTHIFNESKFPSCHSHCSLQDILPKGDTRLLTDVRSTATAQRQTIAGMMRLVSTSYRYAIPRYNWRLTLSSRRTQEGASGAEINVLQTTPALRVNASSTSL